MYVRVRSEAWGRMILIAGFLLDVDYETGSAGADTGRKRAAGNKYRLTAP